MPYADTPPQTFPQPFQNNSVNALGYYVTVSDDGVTTIFRRGRNSSGQIETVNVGSIARQGGFTNSPNATRQEIDYFTANARATVRNYAVPVVNRGIGGAAGGGYARINQILGTQIQPTAASTPTPTPDPVDLNQEIADNTDFLRRNYGTHYYPLSLEDNKQDRIKFTMVRYGNRPLTFTGDNINPLNAVSGSTRNLTQILGSVFLPIQSGISDSSNVEWGGERLDALTATAASLALAGMSIDAQGNITYQVNDLLGAAKTKLFNAASQGGLEALKLYLAQEAASTNGLVSRVTGGVVNPNLELLFAGPQLRPFNFTFKLSPRSQPEATKVRNIIRFFKQGMSVKAASNDIFLKAPNVFNISYESFDPSGNRIFDHPSIGRIKTCALTGFDVNYTPDGSYMTFNDNERTMTSYEISMRFSELEPVTERDFYQTRNNRILPINENHIGY